MKFRNTLIVSIITAVFTSSAASAAIMNYGDPITGGGEALGDVGIIPESQSGTFFTSPNAPAGTISGSLNNNSKITFTYTFSPTSPFEVLASLGGVSSTPNFASANSFGGSVSTGTVFATANISGLNGTTTITNVSGGVLGFQSIFAGFLKLFANGSGGFVGHINYNVSAVPLPASVLMFGAAIAGMFGFTRFKQRKESLVA